MSTTGEIPFKLAYGTEVVILVEVGSLSFRINHFSKQVNSEGIRLNLNLLDEVRELTSARIVDYQVRTTQYYDQRVKPRTFKQGDLVLKEAEASDPLHIRKFMP